MRRGWIYTGGVVLAVAAVVGVAGVVGNSKDHSDTTAVLSRSTTAQKPKQACTVLTLEDAKQVLGASAKGGENGTNVSNQDLEVSSCGYSQNTGNSVIASSKSASLLVRAPKTDRGAISNQSQFGQLKPVDVQTVAGYGDSAYWDSQHGQLNILKNNAWYIVSYGPITPASRTLDQTKQLADILINNM